MDRKLNSCFRFLEKKPTCKYTYSVCHTVFVWVCVLCVCMWNEDYFTSMNWQQLQYIPLDVMMQSHASHGITQHTVYTREMGNILYTSAIIGVLAERYRCPKGSVTSHSPSVFYKKIARICTPRSSTHLHSEPNNLIFLWLLLYFPFIKVVLKKSKRLIPTVPWARFSHLRNVTDPLGPIACVFSSRSAF